MTEPSRRRVVFFNRAYFPESSATSQLLTELAEGLVETERFEVTVVAGIPMGRTDVHSPRPWGLVAAEAAGGVGILRCRGTVFSKERFWGRAVNYITYFLSACWAGLHLKRPDVVVTLTDPPIVGLAAWITAKRFGCPFVISFRDLFPEVGRLAGGPRPVIEAILGRINRFLIRRADRLVALGEDMRRRLIESKGADPARMAIIPDWADGRTLTPGPKVNAFSTGEGLADRFVVMHAGNLGLSQNLDTLIEAASRLRDLPELTVAIVGEGVRKETLKKQAAEQGLTQIRFLPYQPKERLGQVFASADCFVIGLKSGLTGCITPSKLYGILAAGRPFIAATEAGCDAYRLAEKTGCGLTAPPADPAALAQRIRELYNDRAQAVEMGRRAREAFKPFDRPVGIRAYSELLEGFAKK
ncbi:MAG: hypothetical protein COV76_02140 [Candidatus Omnitrophica bacterium CG11_big_fil_rev_8_21_14_0_20_64_10]|nr:MAG: hypothetical protein COV76_02140 [Candidatus Omnitrophica bacterium CG11_big_fil_rev_8_21_14_0_20_64_10]